MACGRDVAWLVEPVVRDIGYQTRVRIDGSGPAVVLVHGTPLELGAWDRLVELLRSDVRLVRYDLRGHGCAAGEPLLASYDVLAADLRRLLDCYGIERAHVVGHSFGGQVAARFGRDYADRLASLTTVCSRWTPFPAFAEAADRIEAGGYSAIVEGIMKRWFTEATLRRAPYPVRYARQAFQRADQASFATALRMISRFDDGRERRAINTTVRIIAAERDQVVTATDLQSVAACAPNCSLTVVRGANHMLPLEHPERLAELLRDGVQA
jgi:3-oxoadipate enol-lactonase